MGVIRIDNGVYTMKSGDYLPEILRVIYGYKGEYMLHEVYEFNNMMPGMFIYEGMKIKLPNFHEEGTVYKEY